MYFDCIQKLDNNTDIQINHQRIKASSSTINGINNQNSVLNVRKQRERRLISPQSILMLLDSIAEPVSPVSPADQMGSTDVTFEPTIEMMVNDFDDEQTLNEEEALAEREAQDPQEEIASLQKESEIPIEELLAKYRQIPPPTLHKNHVLKKKLKGTKSKPKKHLKMESNVNTKHQGSCQENNSVELLPFVDIIVIDSADEEDAFPKMEAANNLDVGSKVSIQNINDLQTMTEAKPNQKRSHLLDLYPENFASDFKTKVIALDALYGIDDEDDEEDAEPDADYVRKTIMVGPAYQAVIPTGLSKYGDILPYENEDKLIWEPIQVSEKEVENYLIKTREIKNCSSENCQGEGNATTNISLKNSDDMDSYPHTEEYHLTIDAIQFENPITADVTRVVKDNEQALHLLVQCGYDFKEALRRKRLNAVPLTGCMSIWSEDECNKFEEGIHKFGKDFLKIRQHQVRTRSMRELVQFYYLWKKSERRDHDFADSDTVDHMDMYLNEGDYSSNALSNTNLQAVNSNASLNKANNRKAFSSALKNFSIMTSSCAVVSGSASNTCLCPSTNTCFTVISKQNVFSPKSGYNRQHGYPDDMVVDKTSDTKISTRT